MVNHADGAFPNALLHSSSDANSGLNKNPETTTTTTTKAWFSFIHAMYELDAFRLFYSAMEP